MCRSKKASLVIAVLGMILVVLLSPMTSLAQGSGTKILSVSPSPLNFGEAVANQQTITEVLEISNTGSEEFTLFGMRITGTDATDFYLYNASWPVTLAPEESMNVGLDFNPSSVGDKSAVLEIESNASNGPVTSVNLFGTGIGYETLGEIVATAVPNNETPEPNEYVRVAINIDMTGANAPADVLTGYQATLSWDPSVMSYYQRNLGDNPWLLPTSFDDTSAAEGVVEWFDFSNEAVGGQFTVLNITFLVLDNYTSGTPLDLEFSLLEGDEVEDILPILTVYDGEIQQIGGDQVPPDISVSPASHDFGDVGLDTTASRTFVVRNNGEEDLEVRSIYAWSRYRDRYLISAGAVPFTLANGETRNVVVDFTPRAPGDRTAQLVFTSNDPNESRYRVHLSATTISPDIDVTPTSLDFGDVLVGTESTLNLTIRNEGESALLLTLYSMEDNENQFAYGFDTIQVTLLNPGQSLGVTILFNPTSAGEKNAIFSIHSNDPNESVVEIPITGNSIVPDIDISPTSLDFGDVPVGTEVTQSLTLSNLGEAPLQLNSVNLDDWENQFGYSFDSGEISSLNPGESTGITVTFSPTSAGAKAATFSIQSNDPDESPLSIPLAGNGLQEEAVQPVKMWLVDPNYR